MADWLQQLWDAIGAVSLPLLVLGLAFCTVQTLLVALAWRNILRAAYPEGDVRYRPVLAYYAGGVGLNDILPASAGTVAMLGLFRAKIRNSTMAGLVGATLVQNIFFAAVSIAIYLWLFLNRDGSFDVKLGWFDDHRVASIVIVVGGAALIVLAVRMLYRRFRTTWENAKEGGAILADRRRFLIEVVGVEAGSYVARMGVNATFMYAFHIPVSVENVFLIVAATSISSTVALFPGAVGAQTALANVVLRDVASADAISSYSVGQSLIVTAWSVGFGLVLLSSEIGWQETRKLLHRKASMDVTESPVVEAEAPERAADT